MLRLDWATAAAARFAVEHWHYSQVLPAGKMVRLGVWEDGAFIGVVLFSRGAAPQIATPFGLTQTAVCELTRVALTAHQAPVSRIVTIALRQLRQHCPALRVVVSFADPAQGHHGGIYQALGWTYLGRSEAALFYRERHTGQLRHPRMLTPAGATARERGQIRARVLAQSDPVLRPGKHKYATAFDAEMQTWLRLRAQPYPKRAD